MHINHIKNIANNKFMSENIVKLTTGFSTIKSDKKYVRMGDMDIQTREDDAVASDLKGILQLVKHFLIYLQVMMHFVNLIISNELHAVFLFYIDRLIKQFIIRTFELVRSSNKNADRITQYINQMHMNTHQIKRSCRWFIAGKIRENC